MSKLSSKDIDILKALGYFETQEDGAILEHPRMSGMNRFVWDDDELFPVLMNFANRLELSLRDAIAYNVKNGSV